MEKDGHRRFINQYLITPAAGKRLIAKALITHPVLQEALKVGTIAIIAGTTNGYIAEELLKSIGQYELFSRKRFFRGITLPPSIPTTKDGRLPDESGFLGDVIIEKGIWKKGLTIFDVVDYLSMSDVILKGANALDLERKRAAIFIGHPKAGTIGVVLQAFVGRRVGLILPVGLEKRVTGDTFEIASMLNDSNCSGPRMLPVPGTVFTEIDAIGLLTGADVKLIAGGGVFGAEGGIWLAVIGDAEQINKTDAMLQDILSEPAFTI